MNGENNTDHLMLLDCPVLGYLTSDKPFPRGEIVAKISARTTPGYFKNEEATRECIVEIGGQKFWRTGDIGMKTDGAIVVIDRLRNFFKLSNGQYVAPSELENVFSSCPGIASCFVFASDDSENIVVAAVPNAPNTTEKELLDQIRVAAQKAQLAGKEQRKKGNKKRRKNVKYVFFFVFSYNFETGHLIPKRVILDFEPWTESNGLLSSIGKLCRPALQKKFHCNVQEIPLPSLSVNSNVPAGIQALLFEIVGASVFDGSTPLSLLGASSLQLASLQNAMNDRFGVSLQIKDLASMTVWDLGRAVFGDAVASVHARDWEAEVRSILKDVSPIVFNDQGKSKVSLEFSLHLFFRINEKLFQGFLPDGCNWIGWIPLAGHVAEHGSQLACCVSCSC